MPPLGIRDLTMPMAAFGMVFVLGSYVYNSIGAARRNAEIGRDKMLGEILESRKKLGMDQDPVAFRRRRKEEAAGIAAAAAAADAADATGTEASSS